MDAAWRDTLWEAGENHQGKPHMQPSGHPWQCWVFLGRLRLVSSLQRKRLPLSLMWEMETHHSGLDLVPATSSLAKDHGKSLMSETLLSYQ